MAGDLLRQCLRVVAVVLFFPCWTAFADIGAPEGAERTAHLIQPYDTYDLPLGVFGHRAIMTEPVDGQITWQAFQVISAELSTNGIVAEYKARLALQGFETLFSCRTDDCGGFDFRFGVDVLPSPAMLLDVHDFEQYTAGRADQSEFVSILASRVGSRIFVQTVSVVPSAPAATVAAAPALKQETAVDVLPGDARDLLEALTTNGHVSIEGLSFQEGGAGLSPDSSDALDSLARLLTRDAGISVVVVGHTDNEGGLEVNLTLSERRAAVVRNALVARGVPKDQISAEGVGYLAPIVSNATPEGRAMNRRVELVLVSDP